MISKIVSKQAAKRIPAIRKLVESRKLLFNEISNLTAQLEAKSTELTTLQAAEHRNREHINSLEAALLSSEQEIRHLRDNISSQTKSISLLEASPDRKDQEIAALSASIDSISNENEGLRLQASTWQHQTSHQIDIISRQIFALKSQCESTQGLDHVKEIDRLNNEIAALKKDSVDLRIAFDRKNDEVVALHSLIAAAETEKMILKAREFDVREHVSSKLECMKKDFIDIKSSIKHVVDSKDQFLKLEGEQQALNIRDNSWRQGTSHQIDVISQQLFDVQRRLGDGSRLDRIYDLIIGQVSPRISALISNQEIQIERLRRELSVNTGGSGDTGNKTRYLDLLEQVLTGIIYEDNAINPEAAGSYDSGDRITGRDWPSKAHTMIGLTRLRNLRMLCTRILDEGVPGDMIETGVWRGGACIFMRGILEAYNDKTKRVFVADSFEGLPPPNWDEFTADKGDKHHVFDQLRVSRQQVEQNFRRYGLLDDRVHFLEGWFKDTLATAPITQLSLLRLDGDMYESTIQALNALYYKVSKGGYVIVDDY